MPVEDSGIRAVAHLALLGVEVMGNGTPDFFLSYYSQLNIEKGPVRIGCFEVTPKS